MPDRERVYTDEEFALVLRKAAELARSAEPGTPSTGLTLAEMKSAAAQAGVDPALVERAARMLGANTSTSSIVRLIGGPLRHEHDVRIAMTLDDESAARLLSAVRISATLAGHQDV